MPIAVKPASARPTIPARPTASARWWCTAPSSGYFNSVFLTLDTTHNDPLTAPVIAQVQEAPLQKIVAGVGYTTDSGPRLSLDHIHNQMPLLGWRAVSRLYLDRDTQSLGTEWSAVPRDSGWRTFTAAQL